MNRWRSTLLTSLAVVTAGALTLGAGAVLGGGDFVRAGMPPHDAGHDRHGRDIRVLGWPGGSWLGVSLEEVSGEKARGALVTGVEEDSPAERAGIREGDIIKEFDGVRILGTRTLTRLVSETPPGRTVELVVERDGRRVKVDAEMEEREGNPRVWSWSGGDGSEFEIDIPEMDIRIPKVFRFSGGRPLLGVSVDTLNPQLAEFLGVRERDGGLLIKEVFEETPADRAGLKAGDVLLEADGRRIESVPDLREVLRDSAGKTIPLLVVRDGSERKVEVTLEEGEEAGWEESRLLRDEQRREVERALRAARRAQREAMREYREQVRELERRRRDDRIVSPGGVVNLGAPVEI